MTTTLKAPFPWTGGKRRVADIVWERFGDTVNYVEPFAGSLAVLLARPFPVRTETVNDADAYLANFWRAVQHDPELVAHYADWPVNEIDLHARHLWLVKQSDFRERMLADPDYYDPKIAGWWVWGLSAWIGSGWCDVESYERKAEKRDEMSNHGLRNGNTRPNLRPAQGVNGLTPAQIPRLSGAQGVHRPAHLTPFQIPHLALGTFAQSKVVSSSLYAYMQALADRLRQVRVVCGDWTRITGASPTYKIGATAVFLDPPYDVSVRQSNLYSVDDDDSGMPISTAVRQWCLEHIDDGNTFSGPRYQHPNLRIALCGYEDEHGPYMPDDWDMVAWKANGGYSNQNKEGNDNRSKERIWFSPNCLKPKTWSNGRGISGHGDVTTLPLFGGVQ